MARIAVSDLIEANWIIDGLKVADAEQAISALCGLFAARSGLDSRLIGRAVALRGDLTTFGLGAGIAMPHGTVAGLARPRAAFTRLATPISFDAADGRPADLVFLLLAPAGDETVLLRALSCVARRMRFVADTVRSARCAEAMHAVLTSEVPHVHRSRRFEPTKSSRPLPGTCEACGGEIGLLA